MNKPVSKLLAEIGELHKTNLKLVNTLNLIAKVDPNSPEWREIDLRVAMFRIQRISREAVKSVIFEPITK